MTSASFGRLALACVLCFFGLDTAVASDRLPARNDFGTAQLAAIQARYDATPDDCGGPDKPAYLCSGVLIRITGVGNFHSWNPSPASVSSGGVSFSYLRADSNFPSLFYNAVGGFILSTKDEAAATLYPSVLCAFPLEAHSSPNRSDKGCGMYTYGGASYPASRPCQSQDVYTAEQWLKHVTEQSDPKRAEAYYYRQCGFTITGGTDPASSFLASVQAQALLPAVKLPYNELILATWSQNVGAALPIEAFFYLTSNSQSLASAQRNQNDLLQTVGVAVPIIKVTLPSSRNGRSSFIYNPTEQVISLPSLPAGLDQPPTMVQVPAGTLRVQDILARQAIDVSVPAQPGLLAGSTVRVRWVGTRTFYETPVRAVAADMPLVISIPRGNVLASLGQSVDVSYVITDKTLAVERASPVLSLAVEAATGSLPPPVLAADRSSVTIAYPGMLSTDQIWVSYEGNGTHDTPYPKKTAPFKAGIVASWLGPPSQVYYWVKRGTQTLVSPVLMPARNPWPIVPDAANGWLDFAALTADPVVTVAPWGDIAEGQSVWLDALAYSPDGTEQRARLLDGAAVDDAMAKDGLRATLSRDWLRRLPDGSAVFLRALSGEDAAKAEAFPVTRLTLRNAPGPIVTKPLPRLVDTQADGALLPVDGLLSRPALKGTLQARIAPWPGMLAGQRVWLRLRGRKADGSELVVDLAPNYVVAVADLTNGLTKAVPLNRLDALSDQSPLTLELKVGFEKLADETRALRFPIDHMAYGK